MLLEISGEITPERMSPQHPFKEKSTVFRPLMEQILCFSPCPSALTRVTSELSILPPTQVSLGISQHLPLPMSSCCYLQISPDFLFSLQVVKWLCVLSLFSRVWLFVTLWTVAYQAPLSTGFSRQEYWNGLSCLPPEDLLTQGSNPCILSLLHCRHILYPWTTGEAQKSNYWVNFFFKITVDFMIFPSTLKASLSDLGCSRITPHPSQGCSSVWSIFWSSPFIPIARLSTNWS